MTWFWIIHGAAALTALVTVVVAGAQCPRCAACRRPYHKRAGTAWCGELHEAARPGRRP